MGTLYLVRHGQASFGAADYDRLSPLGHRQSVRLGEYFRAKGIEFDAVFSGTLRRHRETWAGIAEGQPSKTEAVCRPGLDEYHPEALIATVHAQPLVRATTPEQVRQHFRLLRDGLLAWMAGTVSPQGMPSFEVFASGVREALDHVRERHDGNVLIVSSGGPIAVAVGQVLGAPPATVVELNLRMRNSSLTEFAFNPKRHSLVSYNGVPHLEHAEGDGWITYA
jgi:broad specificity phosphatase PhoE